MSWFHPSLQANYPEALISKYPPGTPTSGGGRNSTLGRTVLEHGLLPGMVAFSARPQEGRGIGAWKHAANLQPLGVILLPDSGSFTADGSLGYSAPQDMSILNVRDNAEVLTAGECWVVTVDTQARTGDDVYFSIGGTLSGHAPVGGNTHQPHAGIFVSQRWPGITANSGFMKLPDWRFSRNGNPAGTTALTIAK